MTKGSYRQFCPVAMAAEVLCSRWTVLVLRELISGSTRFNDLRRGIPRMSPGLLSQRLRELEEWGIVERVASGRADNAPIYRLTGSGRGLEPVLMAIGTWGQQWVEAAPSLQNLDPDLLMWDMRRCLDRSIMPDRRVVVEFLYADQPPRRRRYWLVVTPETDVDVCTVDPGFDVDLYVAVDLRTMTAVWLGLETVAGVREDERMVVTGDRKLAASMQRWLGLSPFAGERKLARGRPERVDRSQVRSAADTRA